MRGRRVIASHDQSSFLVHRGLPDLVKPHRPRKHLRSENIRLDLMAAVDWRLAGVGEAAQAHALRRPQVGRKCRRKGSDAAPWIERYEDPSGRSVDPAIIKAAC